MYNRKFHISKASNYTMDFIERDNINTIEDLLELWIEYGGHSLIIDFRGDRDYDEIMIYDDYIE